MEAVTIFPKFYVRCTGMLLTFNNYRYFFTHFKGYLNNPEATSTLIDSESWLHTGDVGRYNEDGTFYIVDRIKELIKYKGFQVSTHNIQILSLNKWKDILWSNVIEKANIVQEL